MAVLVIAEHDNRSLKPATLNSITAAAAFGVLAIPALVLRWTCWWPGTRPLR